MPKAILRVTVFPRSTHGDVGSHENTFLFLFSWESLLSPNGVHGVTVFDTR